MDRSPTNGATPRADTGDILLAAVDEMSAGDILALVRGASNSGGGIPPEKHAKSVKRHNLLSVLAVLLLGSGGLVANYYTTAALARSNADAIEKHSERPAHPQAVEELRVIKVRIDGIGKDTAATRKKTTEIQSGIQELKEEAQTDKQKRLEEENKKLEREIRRLERER